MYQLNLLQNPNSSEKQKNIYQHVPVSITAILFLAVPCSFGRNVDPSTRDGFDDNHTFSFPRQACAINDRFGNWFSNDLSRYIDWTIYT